MRMVLSYPVVLEPGDGEGVTVISFPDVPEAVSQAGPDDDPQAMAADALGLALLVYAAQGRPLPRASTQRPTVAIEPDVAAKVAVLQAFREAGITQRELARRLGKDDKEVRRILDPMHPTKIGSLAEAIRALGRRIVVGVEDPPSMAASAR